MTREEIRCRAIIDMINKYYDMKVTLSFNKLDKSMYDIYELFIDYQIDNKISSKSFLFNSEEIKILDRIHVEIYEFISSEIIKSYEVN